MPTFTSPVDGTTLFYRYYTPSTSPHMPAADVQRQSLTLVFLHGWPMSSRMFDQLIVPLVETNRFTVIAPDRRGFGNSDWNTPSTGEVTFETFTADLVALLEHLNPGPLVFVASSMGCTESVLAYSTNAYLHQNCRGFVWMGLNMPYSVRCDECPKGPDPALWDSLVNGLRSSETRDFVAQQVPAIFRVDLNNQVGPRTLQFFERLISQADPMAVERTSIICRKPMAAELRAMAQGLEQDRVPILILHGDSDGGMPLETSAAVVHEILPWSTLKVYEKAGHGLYLTHSAKVLEDLLGFVSAANCEAKLE